MVNSFTKKRKENIYLSDDDLSILKRYDIDYNNFSNMKELMFYIEDIINNGDGQDDLEDLLIKLNDYNYYFYTNK
ncbi:MAG: hypothetical protein IJ068_03035 [Bacilli bacterium]|nr:hypothetical protein [Bacilli bacterium]